MSDDLKLFITVFLGSGASFALLNFFAQFWKDRRQRQHVALRVAFHLEAYAIQCEKIHSDHEMHKASGGGAGVAITEIPQLAPYPAEDQFRLLHPQTVDRLYALPQECQIAQRAVEHIWEFVDDDAASEAAADGAIVMGDNALQVARSIRRQYNLEPRQLQFNDWSVEEYFEKELNAILQRKQAKESQMKTTAQTV